MTYGRIVHYAIGMEKTHPIRHLLSLPQFGSRADLARMIGCTAVQVHKWAQFDRIPAEHQQNVVMAAQEKGLSHITAAWMLRVHAEHAQRHPNGIVAGSRELAA